MATYTANSINRYLKYKDFYIDNLKEINGDVDKFERLVDQLSNTSSRALLAHAMAALDITASIESNKKKNIDPYIAAGVGSAIGGLAGGVIAGAGAINQNAKNDYYKTQNTIDMHRSIAAGKEADKRMDRILSELRAITIHCDKADARAGIALQIDEVNNKIKETQERFEKMLVGVIILFIGLGMIVAFIVTKFFMFLLIGLFFSPFGVMYAVSSINEIKAKKELREKLSELKKKQKEIETGEKDNRLLEAKEKNHADRVSGKDAIPQKKIEQEIGKLLKKESYITTEEMYKKSSLLNMVPHRQLVDILERGVREGLYYKSEMNGKECYSKAGAKNTEQKGIAHYKNDAIEGKLSCLLKDDQLEEVRKCYIRLFDFEEKSDDEYMYDIFLALSVVDDVVTRDFDLNSSSIYESNIEWLNKNVADVKAKLVTGLSYLVGEQRSIDEYEYIAKWIDNRKHTTKI